MIFAYARVSTNDQHLEAQVDELKKHGFDELFVEKISGVKADRLQLALLIQKLRKGDTVVVYRLDRLGRSLKHLIELIEKFSELGVTFISLSDAINTQTASGKLVFHIFGAIADFERNLIRERTQVGLKAARARGRMGGRPIGLSEEAQRKAKLADQLYRQQELSISQICKDLGIGSRATLYRYLKWIKATKREPA